MPLRVLTHQDITFLMRGGYTRIVYEVVCYMAVKLGR